MSSAKINSWRVVTNRRSESNLTAVVEPAEQTSQKVTEETGRPEISQFVNSDSRVEHEEDKLSISSLNMITPSPKSVANKIETIERTVPEQSAIEIASDDRISSDEFDRIAERCPSKCEWFVDALSYVRDLPTTKRLNHLVRLWYRIQELDNFRVVDGRNNKHKLSLVNRPRFFDSWMQSHRPLKKKAVPDLDVEQEFLPEFLLWWSSLQPAWRTTLQSEPFSRASPIHSDWSKLCRTGPNGVTLIILALAWMSTYIRSQNALFPTYLLYVNDATWVFKEMVRWMEGGCVTDPITQLTEEMGSSSPTPAKSTKRGRQATAFSSKVSKAVKQKRV